MPLIPPLDAILTGATSLLEKTAMIQGFKDQRARTKVLFERWAAAMNGVEAGELLPNPDQMAAINKLGELVGRMREREQQMVGWLKQAVDLGVTMKLLPKTAPQQFGLEALPLVLGGVALAALAGVVAVGFYAAYRSTADDQAAAAGVTSLVDSYVAAYQHWSEQQPSGPGTLPPAPPETPSVLMIPRPSFASAVGGAISPLLLLGGGLALLMLLMSRKRA